MKELHQIVQESASSFEKTKQELKGCQYGTVYKFYDREEEVETLASNVDRYFTKEMFISSQISLLEEMKDKLERNIELVAYEKDREKVEYMNNMLNRLISYLQDQITKCKELLN